MGQRTEVGELDAGDLSRRLEVVNQLERQRVALIEKRSARNPDARHGDEELKGGHRVWAAADRAVDAALDCQLALPVLLRGHGATGTAMWCLLRGQFEASFRCLWFLDPEDHRERVLRGIRDEWLTDRDAAAYAKLVANEPALVPDVAKRAALQRDRDRLTGQHADVYKAEVKALGQSWTKPERIDVTAELRRLREVPIDGGHTLLQDVWKTLSGLSHGDISALLRVSDQQVVSKHENGALLQLSPSDEMFQYLSGMVLMLTQSALLRYIRLLAPSPIPSDQHPAFFKA